MAGVPFPSFSLSSPPPLLAGCTQASSLRYGILLQAFTYNDTRESLSILVNFKIRVLFYVAMLFFMKIQQNE